MNSRHVEKTVKKVSQSFRRFGTGPFQTLKRAKEALFESEEMPRMLLRHSPDVIFGQSGRGSYLREFQRVQTQGILL